MATRLRYNGLQAALGAAISSTSATSISFAAALQSMGTNIPTLGDEYLALTIDDEIVHLTAYTSGATSGTIVRGQEGTTAATHGNGVAVVHGPTALDFSAPAVNAQTGTSYTLALGDAGAFVTMTNAAASTLTVPPNSSVAFPLYTRIEGAQLGAGQVTLTPGAGVTINATPGLKVAEQYGTFGLIKTATDTWLAFGRLSA